jgi:hypothetical protein
MIKQTRLVMGVRERIEKYRKSGGAADLVRVEVLVPASQRDEILAKAAELRARHRSRNARLQKHIDEAIALYPVRLHDNIDLDRINDIAEKSRLVANVLIERGDARAFMLGRKLLREVESGHGIE